MPNRASGRPAGGPAVPRGGGEDAGRDPLANQPPAKRFPGFFTRIEQAVYREWHPLAVIAANDPTWTHDMFKTRRTVIHVVLAPNGGIIRAYVTVPSGVDWLDEEHLRALWAAAPFPGIPRAMLRAGGQYAEFDFTFTVYNAQDWAARPE